GRVRDGRIRPGIAASVTGLIPRVNARQTEIRSILFDVEGGNLAQFRHWPSPPPENHGDCRHAHAGKEPSPTRYPLPRLSPENQGCAYRLNSPAGPQEGTTGR